jgi:hypothetical protein
MLLQGQSMTSTYEIPNSMRNIIASKVESDGSVAEEIRVKAQYFYEQEMLPGVDANTLMKKLRLILGVEME